MSNTRSIGRILAAAGLVAGVLCWIAGSAVSPAWADDTAAYLAEVASAPGRHVASGLLFLVGSLLLFPGLLAVARLLRGPRGTVGRVGAYLLAVGALVGGGLLLAVSAFEAAMAESGNRAQMVALSERAEESTAAFIGFLGVFVGGFVVGLILLAVGLWLRRAVPLWSALLVLVPVVLLFAVGESRAGSIAGMAVLAAGFAAVAWRLLSISDEQWERSQPLPDPGARSRADELESPSPA